MYELYESSAPEIGPDGHIAFDTLQYIVSSGLKDVIYIKNKSVEEWNLVTGNQITLYMDDVVLIKTLTKGDLMIELL